MSGGLFDSYLGVPKLAKPAGAPDTPAEGRAKAEAAYAAQMRANGYDPSLDLVERPSLGQVAGAVGANVWGKLNQPITTNPVGDIKALAQGFAAPLQRAQQAASDWYSGAPLNDGNADPMGRLNAAAFEGSMNAAVGARPGAMLAEREAAKAGDTLMGVFAGRNARTANLDTLARAESMLGRGAGMDEVYDATKWWRAPDGKMRFEIADPQSMIYTPAFEGGGAHIPGLGSKTVPITQRVTHPELFEAYPDMAQMRLSANPAREGAWYAPRTDVSAEQIALAHKGADYTGDAIQRSLAHELQHAVQRREGFMPGTNPEKEMMSLRARGFKQQPGGPTLRQAADDAYLKAPGEVEANTVAIRHAWGPEINAVHPPWSAPDYLNLLLGAR